MRPVLTAEQSRAQDAAATDPPAVLLERAGLAVALEAARMGAGYGRRVAVLAGPGNNGGDGLIAARFLRQRGASVDLYPLGEAKTPEAAAARRRAIAAGAAERRWDDVRAADLVIDALFGGGFRGELPVLAQWAGTPSLAVDVPSGLDASSGEAESGALAAEATITFHGPKVGHLIGDGPQLSGRLAVADIGLPFVDPEFWECEEADAPLPERARTAHKWSAGSVLVVGGSHGLDGAATLTARAALQSGAGAVMVACPPAVEERIRFPEIMTRAIGAGPSLTADDIEAVLSLAKRFDVMVIGPGLGEGVAEFVRGVLAGHAGPALVDADALNALDDPGQLRRSGGTVITPHAGEFERLAGVGGSYRAAADLARDAGATVLLKGGPTFVMSADDRWVVTSGGPELATIGTGDVLAGMIGAFWAAGLSGADAARSGAYWHGRTGRRLAAARSVTADRLLDEIGVVTRRPV